MPTKTIPPCETRATVPIVEDFLLLASYRRQSVSALAVQAQQMFLTNNGAAVKEARRVFRTARPTSRSQTGTAKRG